MKTYEKDFPYFKAKTEGVTKKFNLSDPVERKEYFEAKAGEEIAQIKKYLESNTFVAYLLGKKNSGKGTYSKLMKEIFGEDKIGHISVGDIVRDAHAAMEDETKKAEIMEFMEKNYRGYISIDDAINALLGRDQKTLLPTEFILALIKMQISKWPKKSLFIDGFPRELDQISYSLFLSNLIDYRSDLDIFIAISIPESVLDERMKFRVICPVCHTPRNLKLFATKEVGFDKEANEFFLKCDQSDCSSKGARMIGKEGDNLGIETIRERLELDDKLIEKVFTLHGVPRILLRNAIPVDVAKDYVDDYEITPEYVYELGADGEVKVGEKSYAVKDDEGVESYSLLAPPVALALIKQLAAVIKNQSLTK
ncbi:MAG: nucleoside monophosphate kinase [Patescibacteria group bacterium]|nr:nucleoside monophosphate kinase [Patescibacteria group bacterium]